MEMAVKRKDCTALVGDVHYPGTIYLKNAWARISKVYGTVTVDGTSERSLGTLRKITVDGWQPRVVRIVNNRKLLHIDEILEMKVAGPEPHFWFQNNTGFCHTPDIRQKIEAKAKTKLSWDDKCLTSCPGGVVSANYLNSIGKLCHIIDGDLVIEGLK
ncbi:hypothetical protein COOONC_17162, partial [Cooperia oncophora]